MVIRVVDITRAADTHIEGIKLYDHLVSALGLNDKIVISFAGIDTATSSFVNSSFVPLLDEISFDDIKRRIRVVDSSRQINDMIRTRMISRATVAA